jgi:dGTP triphosphohydrolase
LSAIYIINQFQYLKDKIDNHLFLCFRFENPTGHLCYQNALIQALSGQGKFIHDINFESYSSTLNHFKNIMAMRLVDEPDALQRALKKFREVLWQKVHKDYANLKIDQDAGELLGRLLDTVMTEIQGSEALLGDKTTINVVQRHFEFSLTELTTCSV